MPTKEQILNAKKDIVKTNLSPKGYDPKQIADFFKNNTLSEQYIPDESLTEQAAVDFAKAETLKSTIKQNEIQESWLEGLWNFNKRDYELSHYKKIVKQVNMKILIGLVIRLNHKKILTNL